MAGRSCGPTERLGPRAALDRPVERADAARRAPLIQHTRSSLYESPCVADEGIEIEVFGISSVGN